MIIIVIGFLLTAIIIVALFVGIGEGTVQNFGGNKQIFDTNAKYNKAYINIGNETIKVDVKKWKDYEGEQIQIVTTDGQVYLVSSYNTILVNEKIEE